jgi:hypothetical protein
MASGFEILIEIFGMGNSFRRIAANRSARVSIKKNRLDAIKVG